MAASKEDIASLLQRYCAKPDILQILHILVVAIVEKIILKNGYQDLIHTV